MTTYEVLVRYEVEKHVGTFEAASVQAAISAARFSALHDVPLGPGARFVAREVVMRMYHGAPIVCEHLPEDCDCVRRGLSVTVETQERK